MTGAQLKAKLKRLRLTQVEFANLTGVNKMTAYHWAKGDRPVPAPVEALIALIDRLGSDEAIDALREHRQNRIWKLASPGLQKQRESR